MENVIACQHGAVGFFEDTHYSFPVADFATWSVETPKDVEDNWPNANEHASMNLWVCEGVTEDTGE